MVLKMKTVVMRMTYRVSQKSDRLDEVQYLPKITPEPGTRTRFCKTPDKLDFINSISHLILRHPVDEKDVNNNENDAKSRTLPG